jgi:hypothetical protein
MVTVHWAIAVLIETVSNESSCPPRPLPKTETAKSPGRSVQQLGAPVLDGAPNPNPFYRCMLLIIQQS